MLVRISHSESVVSFATTTGILLLMSQGQPPLALVLLALRRIGASEGQHAWLRGQLVRLRVPMVRGNTSTKSVPRRHAGHKLGDRANPQATGVKDALMDSKWQSS